MPALAVAGPPGSITVLEVLEATRPGSGKLTAEAEAVDVIVNSVSEDLLVHAALAYFLAASPQPVIRVLSHQMDRCGGTNISKFTFGGFALSIAAGVIDAWGVDTMIPGHSKFGPDAAALQLANK